MDGQEQKLHNQNSGNETPMQDMAAWHVDICRGITMAYFLVMTLLYPLYAPGGYLRIDDEKYRFFKYVSLATLLIVAAVLLVAALAALLRGRGSHWLVSLYRRMSVTDWFAYGYCVMVMLSYLCSAYQTDALWGAEGWYMGAATQMLMVLLYFLFSRYFHVHGGWLGMWLTGAAAVFALGVCNRYSVYPFTMAGQTETFISTLGNINWFCGYWSVAAAVGITWYWCGGGGVTRVLTGIYSALAMLCGVTQGSSSAYLVFGAMGAGLLFLSLGDVRKLCRLLELCMLFGAVCQLGRALRYLPGLTFNYGLETGITAALLDSNATLWGLLAAALCYGVLHRLARVPSFSMEKEKRRLRMALGGVVALSGAVAVILLFRGGIVGMQEQTEAGAGGVRIVFWEDFGNGRGAAWNCGMDAYRGMDAVHKLVGVGPDCFADYVYTVPELADRLAERFAGMRLTNAHSEPLTQLVNVGLLGFLSYTGIFISALIRWLRRAHGQPLLYVCAMGVLAYAVHGLVSFQQVLNAPYVFILMGIGERVYQSVARVTGEQKSTGWGSDGQ